MVDWSWALIHSIMIEWNRISIKQYLNEAYHYLEIGLPFNSDFVVVYTCCDHFVKQVSNMLQRKLAKEDLRKPFIMENIALMEMGQSLEEFDKIFLNFIFVLLKPDEKFSLKYLGQINEFFQKKPEYIYIASTEGANISGEEFDESIADKSIYASSAFYKRYTFILQKLQRSVEKKF